MAEQLTLNHQVVGSTPTCPIHNYSLNRVKHIFAAAAGICLNHFLAKICSNDNLTVTRVFFNGRASGIKYFIAPIE